MHDSELEQRLRAALRAEGDELAFRVDVERLEAEVALRKRNDRANRFGLVAAAVAVVAFGMAAVGLNAIQGPNEGAATPPPAPTTRPVPTVAPAPASPLPAGLVALEPRRDSTILLEVEGAWSGTGARHVVELPEPMTSVTTVQVACIDESVTVDAEGAVTDLASITVTTDDGPIDAVCMGEQPSAVIPSLTDQPTAVDIVVPAGVAYMVLVDSVPAPEALPTIELTFGTVEVEGASENALPDWSAGGGRVRTVVGTLDEGFAQDAVVVCLGPGTLKVEFRDPTAPAESPATGGGVQCTGDAQALTFAIGARGPHDVVVEADSRASWHVIAGSHGTLPPFDPPGFYMSSWLEDTDITGSVTSGIAGCNREFLVDGRAAASTNAARRRGRI